MLPQQLVVFLLSALPFLWSESFLGINSVKAVIITIQPICFIDHSLFVINDNGITRDFQNRDWTTWYKTFTSPDKTNMVTITKKIILKCLRFIFFLIF